MKNLLKTLHIPNWLAALLVIVLVLRIPSFFEPYSYGDEMIYLALGEAIRQNIPLYLEIHDNKPPLLYLIAAISGSLFWFKAILAIWHLITVFIFWKLMRHLFPKNKKAQILSTSIFAILTTLPLLEGNIANAEIFMVGPTILAFYLLLTKKLNFKNLFIAGTLFSVSTLFKVPAAFDMPTIFFLWIVSVKSLTQKSLRKLIKNIAIVLIGFTVPILFTFLWYWLRGAFNEYLVAAFLQNVGYLSSWRPSDVQEPFLTKNSPLILRSLTVAIGLLTLYLKRNKLSKNFIFAVSWLLFALFAVTLSERPYPHYLIQAVPAVAILLTFLITKKTKEQVFAIIPLTLALIVPVYFNFWYYPTAPYYERFVSLATGSTTKQQYLQSFGAETLTNYKIAKYIASNTKRSDKVFVWGNSSAIYALSKRLPPIKYVADYHINDFSSEAELLMNLKANLPEFFVILPKSKALPPKILRLLGQNYALLENIDQARIWKLLTPSVRALLSQ